MTSSSQYRPGSLASRMNDNITAPSPPSSSSPKHFHLTKDEYLGLINSPNQYDTSTSRSLLYTPQRNATNEEEDDDRKENASPKHKPSTDYSACTPPRSRPLSDHSPNSNSTTSSASALPVRSLDYFDVRAVAKEFKDGGRVELKEIEEFEVLERSVLDEGEGEEEEEETPSTPVQEKRSMNHKLTSPLSAYLFTSSPCDSVKSLDDHQTNANTKGENLTRHFVTSAGPDKDKNDTPSSSGSVGWMRSYWDTGGDNDDGSVGSSVSVEQQQQQRSFGSKIRINVVNSNHADNNADSNADDNADEYEDATDEYDNDDDDDDDVVLQDPTSPLPPAHDKKRSKSPENANDSPFAAFKEPPPMIPTKNQTSKTHSALNSGRMALSKGMPSRLSNTNTNTVLAPASAPIVASLGSGGSRLFNEFHVPSLSSLPPPTIPSPEGLADQSAIPEMGSDFDIEDASNKTDSILDKPAAAQSQSQNPSPIPNTSSIPFTSPAVLCNAHKLGIPGMLLRSKMMLSSPPFKVDLGSLTRAAQVSCDDTDSIAERVEKVSEFESEKSAMQDSPSSKTQPGLIPVKAYVADKAGLAVTKSNSSASSSASVSGFKAGRPMRKKGKSFGPLITSSSTKTSATTTTTTTVEEEEEEEEGAELNSSTPRRMQSSSVSVPVPALVPAPAPSSALTAIDSTSSLLDSATEGAPPAATVSNSSTVSKRLKLKFSSSLTMTVDTASVQNQSTSTSTSRSGSGSDLLTASSTSLTSSVSEFPQRTAEEDDNVLFVGDFGCLRAASVDVCDGREHSSPPSRMPLPSPLPINATTTNIITNITTNTNTNTEREHSSPPSRKPLPTPTKPHRSHSSPPCRKPLPTPEKEKEKIEVERIKIHSSPPSRKPLPTPEKSPPERLHSSPPSRRPVVTPIKPDRVHSSPPSRRPLDSPAPAPASIPAGMSVRVCTPATTRQRFADRFHVHVHDDDKPKPVAVAAAVAGNGGGGGGGGGVTSILKARFKYLSNSNNITNTDNNTVCGIDIGDDSLPPSDAADDGDDGDDGDDDDNDVDVYSNSNSTSSHRQNQNKITYINNSWTVSSSSSSSSSSSKRKRMIWKTYTSDSQVTSSLPFTNDTDCEVVIDLSCIVLNRYRTMMISPSLPSQSINQPQSKSQSKSSMFEIHPTKLIIPPYSMASSDLTYTPSSSAEITTANLEIEIKSTSKSTMSNRIIKLKGTAVNPPSIQVDRPDISWVGGGSSRLIKVRNCSFGSVSVEFDAFIDSYSDADADADDSGVDRFEIVNHCKPVLHSNGEAGVWVRCFSGDGKGFGCLTLSVLPLFSDADDGNSDDGNADDDDEENDEDEVMRTIEPRLFDVKLYVSGAEVGVTPTPTHSNTHSNTNTSIPRLSLSAEAAIEEREREREDGKGVFNSAKSIANKLESRIATPAKAKADDTDQPQPQPRDGGNEVRVLVERIEYQLLKSKYGYDSVNAIAIDGATTTGNDGVEVNVSDIFKDFDDVHHAFHDDDDAECDVDEKAVVASDEDEDIDEANGLLETSDITFEPQTTTLPKSKLPKSPLPLPSADDNTLSLSTTTTTKSTPKKRGRVYFKKSVLDFGQHNIGTCGTLHINLCNSTSSPITLKFHTLDLPFIVLHKKIKVMPRSYVRVPVRFVPVGKGGFEFLVRGVVQGGDGREIVCLVRGVGT